MHSQHCNLTAIVLSCGLFCTGIQLATVILAGIRLNRKTLIVGDYRNPYPQSLLHQRQLIGRSFGVTTRIAHLRRGPSLVASKDLTLIEVSPCKSPAALQLG